MSETTTQPKEDTGCESALVDLTDQWHVIK